MFPKFSRALRLLPLFALVSSPLCLAASQSLSDSYQAQQQLNQNAAQSQQKIDQDVATSQALRREFNQTKQELDSLRLYNDQLEKMVRSQQQEQAALQQQILEIDDTRRDIVPLMIRMVDQLKAFVLADLPFRQRQRLEKVQELDDLMNAADISTAEKYRLILAAYQEELVYGRTIATYKESIQTRDNEPRTYQFLRFGRVALLYQSLDGEEIGYWDQKQKEWQPLSQDYGRFIRDGIRMAARQAPPSLIRVPVATPTRQETH